MRNNILLTLITTTLGVLSILPIPATAAMRSELVKNETLTYSITVNESVSKMPSQVSTSIFEAIAILPEFPPPGVTLKISQTINPDVIITFTTSAAHPFLAKPEVFYRTKSSEGLAFSAFYPFVPHHSDIPVIVFVFVDKLLDGHGDFDARLLTTLAREMYGNALAFKRSRLNRLSAKFANNLEIKNKLWSAIEIDARDYESGFIERVLTNRHRIFSEKMNLSFKTQLGKLNMDRLRKDKPNSEVTRVCTGLISKLMLYSTK